MFAGLPGTGIGGLFYLLMTIWMPFREAYLVTQGRSSMARWRFIGMRWVVFGAVLVVIWGQMLLMRGLMPAGAPGGGELAAVVGLDEHALNKTSGGGMILMGLASLTALILVIVGMHLLRVGVKVYDRARA